MLFKTQGMLDNLPNPTKKGLIALARLTGRNIPTTKMPVVRLMPSKAVVNNSPTFKKSVEAPPKREVATASVFPITPKVVGRPKFSLPAQPITDAVGQRNVPCATAEAADYDLDSEDEEWMHTYNSRRGDNHHLTPARFERSMAHLLVDRSDLFARVTGIEGHRAAVLMHFSRREADTENGGAAKMLPRIEKRLDNADGGDFDGGDHCGYPVFMDYDPLIEPMAKYPASTSAKATSVRPAAVEATRRFRQSAFSPVPVRRARSIRSEEIGNQESMVPLALPAQATISTPRSAEVVQAKKARALQRAKTKSSLTEALPSRQRKMTDVAKPADGRRFPVHSDTAPLDDYGPCQKRTPLEISISPPAKPAQTRLRTHKRLRSGGSPTKVYTDAAVASRYSSRKRMPLGIVN